MMNPSHLKTLLALTSTPTAPYAEQHVLAFVQQWAEPFAGQLQITTDKAFNIYLRYQAGPALATPLFVEAHMDHPGFVTTGDQPSNATLQAQFRGHVRPSCFVDARAQFWVNTPAANAITPVAAKGQWVKARVLGHRDAAPFPLITLEKPTVDGKAIELPPNTLGMWDLPDSAISGELLTARVCDDLAGCAAALCLLEDLITHDVQTDVTVLLSRAEEVGFAGAIAAMKIGMIPKHAAVIGLETSKSSALAPQGDGPVIRVGDKTGTFSPGLTHFVTQCAGHLGDSDSGFKFQRKLMDAGTCNTTAFTAFGFDAAGITLPLGNYHNQHLPGDTGYGQTPTAGPHIGSETIHIADFHHLTQLLRKIAERMPHYQPHYTAVRSRIEKLYDEQQAPLLFDVTTNPPTPLAKEMFRLDY